MSNIFNQIRSVTTPLSKFYKPSVTFARSVLIASAAVTLSLIGARQLGILESVELAAYDQMVRWRPDESPDSRLLIVGITESDIQRLKQWPISDRKITEILQKLEKLQPRVIGLDVLRDVPQGEGRDQLAKFLRRSDRTIGVCLVTDGTVDSPGTPPPPGIPKDRIGFADFGVDSGGIVRRALLFMKPPAMETNYHTTEKHLCNDNSQVLFSFNLQLALRYLQTQKIYPKLAKDQSLWLGKKQFKKLEPNDGEYQNVDVRGYQILINYRSRSKVANQVKLTDVLAGKINPNLVKDKIVLIGYTTETVKDFFYTPYSAGKDKNQFMPGIVTHAQVVSQILSAVLDDRPLFWFWPEWLEILWISGWSIVGGTLAWRITHPTRLILTFVGMLGVCCITSFGIFWLGGWVPMATPALALVVTGGSIVLADRFNKSGYGKVITDRVKQVFKIEIDQAQKDEQVAEITQSPFFKELQQKKDLLRASKKELSAPSASPPAEIPKITAVSTTPQNAESQPQDYLAHLKQKSQKHKQRVVLSEAEQESQTPVTVEEKGLDGAIETPTDGDLSDLSAQPSQTPVTVEQTLLDGAMETQADEELSDLQAKARQMRQRKAAKNRLKNPTNQDY
ncbi:MAG: CHASE2 domain-containing protein [Oscillatoriales cyanobacterium]|uniref:CHASE2 domain-containing protein n=1 Tax=Microcoleus anatoxicus PTRS2 TaxID=2705321 RepID=A0ABU8YIA3_9CYAN|nr:MAG: CHASE2 domain-containing protein [Oscillatoriales cyanobacterium]TAD97815.1 MAG: CHASE2 domain-containing protein [Oscillatoriales cyanobacterium]TAE04929.1 MAG: CHASE2 domain-containing protein [Oscillatoriales cyanobacterium]TAE99065.1 MAG: CHASE2 domain-containing protein [Oscillatoriales cyanobacterium]TAF63517.1 MAG: CHASE2 domain-containing protein [Oscillatoriales cyanobacterium]